MNNNILSYCDLFQTLTTQQLNKLAQYLHERPLIANEILFAQGDLADAMYIVTSGNLEVVLFDSDHKQHHLQTLGVGQYVGEMGLLNQHRRVASVFASQDSTVLRLNYADFESLLHNDAQLLKAISDVINPRYQFSQFSSVIRAIFGELNAETSAELQTYFEWVQCDAGHVLFRQDDVADALYLVISGKMQALKRQSDGSEQVVGLVGPSESIGEAALFMNEKRSATVRALRDSQLLRLDKQQLDSVVQRYPQILLNIARSLMQRQHGQISHSNKARIPHHTICIVPLQAKVTAQVQTQVVAALTRQLQKSETLLYLNADRFESEFGIVGSAQLDTNHLLASRMIQWLQQQENHHTVVLFEADAPVAQEMSEWTRRCIRAADKVVLLGDVSAGPMVSPYEQALRRAYPNVQFELALLHPPTTDSPKNTRAWLTERSTPHPPTHYHVRQDYGADYDRMARRLIGRAYGLVLSGGGARGYAHVGVIRALTEAKIPFDYVGGTSMGAHLAGGLALGFSWQYISSQIATRGRSHNLLDYTVPIVSVYEGKKVNQAYQEAYAEMDIADLWLPYFCISSNLTRAKMMVHEHGSMWRAVRASTCYPGIWSPIQNEAGDWLVDGCMLNNWPVDVMREKIGSGTIIASTVSMEVEFNEDFEIGDSVSGFKLLAQRLVPWRRKRQRLPRLTTTVIRAMELSAIQSYRDQEVLADVVVKPDMSKFSVLHFDRFSEIIAVGYAEMQRVLAQPDTISRLSLGVGGD